VCIPKPEPKERDNVKKAKRFPVVEMQGSHYDMGRQYGAQCRDVIRDLIGKFDEIILRSEEGNDEAYGVAREAVPWVRESAPELIEEVSGIAAGAGVDFDDVFRLNCSVELFAWKGCAASRSAVSVPPGCTSFAARTSGGSLVAWNMDWWRLWLPYIVLLKGKPAGEPAFFAFAFAGCVGRPGMSERIAISANQLPYRPAAEPPNGSPQWAGPGIPYNFLSRMLLQQSSTSDALALIARTRRMAGLNYTIGDADGDVCCVETTPTAHEVLRSEEGFVVHANSFHTAKFGGLSEAEQEQRDPRAFHARERLRQCHGALDREAIAEVQTCHFPGQPGGVCVHRNLQDREGITLLSFVAEVGSGRMWVAHGPPCEHEFLLHEL